MLPDHERRVIRKFLDGHTHQQIADAYGVSKQAVQQFLKTREITKHQGGYIGGRIPVAKRARRDARHLAKLERHARRYYGMGLADLKVIKRRRDGEPNLDTLKIYQRQRKAALHCGHGWALPFPAWWAVWEASGRWAQRGRGAGQFSLIRYDMTKPFRPDNVYVAPFCNRHRSFEGKGGTDDGQTVHPTRMPDLRDAPVGARAGDATTLR